MPRPIEEEFRLFRWKLWLTVLFAAGVTLAYFLRYLILLTFLSLLIALFWDTIAGVLQGLARGRMPRWLGVTLAVVVSFAAVVLFVFAFSQPLSDQLKEFLAEWPRIRQDLWMRLNPILRRVGFDEVSPESLTENGLPEGIVPMGIKAVGIGAHALAMVAAVFFLAFFWALQPDRYREGLLKLLPPAAATWANVFLREIVVVLRQWLKATGLAIVAISVLTTLLLTVFGIPYALLFGAAAGIFDMIPFLGPTLAFLGPALITLTMAPEKLPLLVLGYLIVQTVEGNVVQPYVMNREAELPPALTIFAILAMSSLFGILGLFLAAPTLTILFALWRVIETGRKEKKSV